MAAVFRTTAARLAKPARVNYFNGLTMEQKLKQLAVCRFMGKEEFAEGAAPLHGKKIVIVGCGAQGLNQGLNPSPDLHLYLLLTLL